MVAVETLSRCAHGQPGLGRWMRGQIPNGLEGKSGMDIKEAAKVLDVSTGTIRNWIRAGKLNATTHVENARIKYKLNDEEVVDLQRTLHSKLAEPEREHDAFAPVGVHISMDVESAETPTTSVSPASAWGMQAIRTAVKESFHEVSDSMQKHIHQQYALYEALQSDFTSLQSEVAATMEELTQTKTLVRHVHDVLQRDRDTHVVKTLQTTMERGRHRKRKTSWW